MAVHKYAASMKPYPGLQADTSLDFPAAAARVVRTDGVPHSVAITNASLRTYEVTLECACNNEHLCYQKDAVERSTWSATFVAPFRWNAMPRTTLDTSTLAARQGSGTARDREVNVRLTFKSEPYDPVGPVTLTLQVDSDGN
jgi:hypothetical protein